MPTFDTKQRDKLAEEDLAEPDGSYPIRNTGDLKRAIESFGRSSNPEKTKAWIKRRAKELGSEDLLPEGWSTVAKAKPDNAAEDAIDGGADDAEETGGDEMTCPECDSTDIKNGKCQKCGATVKAVGKASSCRNDHRMLAKGDICKDCGTIKKGLTEAIKDGRYLLATRGRR
jgi:hypothetical protein